MNIPFKTKLPALDQTTLAKRNKVFDSLSEEDKRKEIAFDGLNLVITGQVGAAKGTYWSGAIYDIVVPLKTSKQLQEALNLNLSEDCRVCQRGLMMISQIRLGNSVRPDDVDVDCGVNEAKSIAEGIRERKNNVINHFQYDAKVAYLKEHGLPQNTVDNANFKKVWNGVLADSNGLSLEDIAPERIKDAIENPDAYNEVYDKAYEKFAGKRNIIDDTESAKKYILDNLPTPKETVTIT